MLAGYRVTSQKVSRIVNIKFKKYDGTVVPGQVTLQNEADENEDLVAVKIKLAEKTYEARAESYFETLQNLRKELERDGIQILCNGAARNVYPSPMTLAMGYGRKASKMTWGKQALRKDLVDIFGYDESLVCCGVEEQNQYYMDWIQSLRK